MASTIINDEVQLTESIGPFTITLRQQPSSSDLGRKIWPSVSPFFVMEVIPLKVSDDGDLFTLPLSLSLLKSKVLSHYLYWNRAKLVPKHLPKDKQLNCLELGAGCGLVGITLAKLGFNVTLTDQKEVNLSR